MTDAPFPIERLRKRPEFLACAQAPSCAKGALVVQALARQDARPLVRAGFTATKRIGGAVVRNRAKRRMREAARQLLPEFGRPGFDYVFIARNGAVTRPWLRLLDDMKSALLRLAPESDRRASDIAPEPPSV
jgi:ribonuclease P protein component